MHPVFLIEGQFQDGTPHSCGMSVCQSAILHHHHSAPDCSQLGVFICAFPPVFAGFRPFLRVRDGCTRLPKRRHFGLKFDSLSRRFLCLHVPMSMEKHTQDRGKTSTYACAGTDGLPEIDGDQCAPGEPWLVAAHAIAYSPSRRFTLTSAR